MEAGFRKVKAQKDAIDDQLGRCGALQVLERLFCLSKLRQPGRKPEHALFQPRGRRLNLPFASVELQCTVALRLRARAREVEKE